MATGGWSPPSSFEILEEQRSHKYLAIESLFDNLVEGIASKVRHFTEGLHEKGALDDQQREKVVKALKQDHLEADYPASLLLRFILTNVECDDTHFDRLVLALRDVNLHDLAEELVGRLPALAPDTSDVLAMEVTNGRHDGSRPSLSSLMTNIKKSGEEVSQYDSGVITPVSTTPTSMNTHRPSFSNEHHMDIEYGQLTPSLDQPVPVSLDSHVDQSCTSPLQGNTPGNAALTQKAENNSHHRNTPTTLSDSSDDTLQSLPQLQEPLAIDVTESQHQQAPIQVHNEQSNAILLVPESEHYLSTVDEASDASSSESLVDQLLQRLTEMRLELQHKEQELQSRNQEQQQNSELIARCQDLEEKVKTTEDEMKAQKRRADKVSNEKDIEIDLWKKKCEEKENEIKQLQEKIAIQELEKDELTKRHLAEIGELRERQEESANQVDSYELKVAALNRDLKEATEKKEIAEQQLKEADSKIQQAENERSQVHIQLLQSIVAKERELSQLKDANHKLELEIRDLVNKNQSLEVEKKDTEVLLHQRDKELAEHKLAAAEEKHDTCARELKSERQQTQQLQDENNKLKRQLSEYQEQSLASESLAKRSKTS